METTERISYEHRLFVDREQEYDQVLACYQRISDLTTGESRVLILTGERGTGKSWFLEEVRYRLQTERNATWVFKIDLQSKKGQDPYAAVRSILEGIFCEAGGAGELNGLPSEASRQVMEQLHALGQPVVLLADHVYEADWNLIEVFEDYLFAPLAVQPGTLLVMAGRGRHFQWHTPELIDAVEIQMRPFASIDFTKQQIVAIYPEQKNRITEIHRISAGYPLCNLILAQHSGVDGFREIVDFYLESVPPDRRDSIRQVLEILCVLRSFDEYRLQAMLVKAEPALAGKPLDPHQLIQEIQSYGFASWVESAQAYKLDRAIQMAFFGDLRVHDSNRLTRLQRNAQQMYYSWVQKFPDTLRRWDKDISYHDRDPYSTALATRDLIGRGTTSDQVKKIIYEEEGTRVVHLEGSGGIGKTFFLRQMLRYLKEERKDREGQILYAAELIDLYQTPNHSADGLTSAIYDQLAKTVAARGMRPEEVFKHYLVEREAYESLLASRFDRDKAKLHFIQMRLALVEDINRLAEQYRVVLFFDTLEFILLEDPIAKELDVEYKPGLESYSWLCSEFLPGLKNTVVLIAGRPQPTLGHAPFHKLPKGLLFYEKLQGLNREEFSEYLNAVAAVVSQQEIRDIAAEFFIQMLCDQDVTKIYESLCEYDPAGKSLGVRPILFSLVIDHLVLCGGKLPAEITRFPVGEKLSPEERQRRRSKLEKELITSLYHFNRPADPLIFFLACARKEMNLEMLAQLLNLHNKKGEPDIKLANIRLESLRYLSFVKYRPDQQQIVLHDEMYEMFRTYVLDQKKNQARLANFYKVVNEYYLKRIAKARNEIECIFRLDPKMGIDSFAAQPNQNLDECQKSILNWRQELQSAIVDYLHYQLRQDLEEGFNVYFRYADEAALNDDDNLDYLLKVELKGVFLDEENHAIKTGNQERLAEVKWLFNRFILPDSAVRFVKRQWQEGSAMAQHKAAQAADKLRGPEDAHLLSEGDDLSKLEFSSWDGLVLARRHHYEEAILKLDDTIARLNELAESGITTDRLLSILARALNNGAFVARKLGMIVKAHEMYHDALIYWRRLEMRAEMANTLNNLAYVECLQGEFESAQQHAHESREIRVQEGSRTQIVLSWSTIAEINTYEGKFIQAEQAGKMALELASQADYPVGMGLACLALAGINRYRSEPDKGEPDKDPHKFLIDAKGYAERALDIFLKEFDPESRVRALYEVGVIQRELFRLKQDSKEQLHSYFLGAEDYLTRAQNKANEYGLWTLYADALLGQAWLYYYAGERARMNELLEKFDRQMCGKEWERYVITPTFLPTRERDLVLGMFAHLARREGMNGRIKLDEYEASGRKDTELLRSATVFYTRAFHYYSLISDNYRDIHRASQLIYLRLNKFTDQELLTIFDSVPDLQNQNKSQTLFWRKMEEKFGRYETRKRIANRNPTGAAR